MGNVAETYRELTGPTGTVADIQNEGITRTFPFHRFLQRLSYAWEVLGVMKKVLKRIEELRQKLNSLGDGPLTDSEVVEISKALDKVLNQYSRQLRDKGDTSR